MESKFDFYEIVKVVSEDEAKSPIFGLEGAILGMSQDDDGNWGYAVFIYTIKETWDCFEPEIEATGKMDTRETFYPGASIKVEVDPETGEGKLKEDDD